MMSMRKNAITIKRALLIFAIIIFVATCIAGCGAGADTSDKTEGTAENRFRNQMADAGVTEIAVKNDLVLEAPVEINGTKVLYGEGSITAVGDAWAGDDYMIVVQPGAQLTVKGSVSIDAGGITGGIRAAQDAVWSIEETASVKNASAMAANTLVEGAFHMNGGTMAGAMGHNVYNMGEVTVSEGEIIGSGTKCAGIYSEGILTQNGGTIRDAYNNVVVLSGGSFHFNGGNNQDSIHDGIYIAEDAKLSVTAKSATITGSGVRGIYLCGEATIDGITLNSSGDSLVKISQTGTLNLNGGTLADAGYHSVENAGKMVMTGGSVRNSYNCGIVNSGTLEITGGSILDNAKNKGVLNKHDGKATISGQAVMFSGNRFAIANEDTATLDLSKAEILLTTTTNVYAFDGEVNIHDISLGAAGSNNVRIYKAEVTMNNVQVLGNSSTGSATTHGILLEGGELNAKDVTIKNTTGYGIRNKGGHITAENLLISKSIKAGGINNAVQDHTGLPGIADIKNLTIEEIRYNNIVVDGGTLTITDGHLAASGTNNVKTTDGVLNLNNVDILGNLPDTDGTNHAVYMTGGKIVAEDVNISNAKVSGLRINGETAVFTGNKVTIRNSKKYGIDQTIGQVSVNNMTLTGNYYNINNTKGTIGLSNSTLGPTVSNNVRTHGGLVDLQNVEVNGHTKNHVNAVHALFISGGTLTGQNITVKDVSNAGLRVSGGTANIQGLTVNDAGADGVWISEGKATISDLVIKQAGAAGIAATGDADITVTGGSIANTVSHGAKSENTAKLTLKDISVAIATTDGRHAVLAQGGDVHLEDVKITGVAANSTGAGVRINRDTSHVTGKGVSIAEVNIGISANAGTSDISGLTTTGIMSHSVYASVTANLVLSDSTFGVSGTNNVKAESNGTVTLNHSVIEGTKTNHGIMAENGGYIYGKDVTVKNTAGCAVRVKCSSAGNQVEIDGLVTENVGAQNIWINKDQSADNVGSVVIKNGDLCRTGTHNVRAEAGNLTLIDTKIQGHQSGVANNIHAIYVSTDVDQIALNGVTVQDAAGDALRIAAGTVVATDFTSEKTGRNGVWVDGGSLAAQNITVTDSKKVGVNVSGNAGTVVLNGATISGSEDNVMAAGAELTINGYADGSKSQIGTSTKDNVVANDGGIIRLNDVDVAESATNNVVTTGGEIYLTDSSVTGGNYSVLVQDAGYAELNNVTITDPASDAVRVNKADGVVVANNVQINNPIRYGISAEKGTVEIKGDLTIGSNAKKSRAIYAYNGGKVTTEDGAKVTISNTEYGIYADTDKPINMSNVAISGCAKSSVEMKQGTVVLNGVNISGSSANNILVSGGELTVNAYANNSNSQIGTATEDNIKATGTGVIRLNNVDVLKTSKNNVVAITGGTVHMKDSAVTGGNHSVLADNTGTVYLTNVTIKDSVTSGIRANNSASFVEATDVTIDGAKTGLSISQGTVKITDITIRNTKDVGVSVAQSTSAANVTLNNLVTENCGTHAIYTSGASANLTVNGGTLGNDGSDHVINLNGGPMALNDVAINGTNLAAGQYELYSGAGWLTIGGAMDANIYIATDPGRVIKVNKELTGNDLVVDWKNAPTGAALEFTSEAMMNASKDNIALGATQTALDGRLSYYSENSKGYAKLVNKVVTSEAQLNDYLTYAKNEKIADVEILIGGSFNVANQVTIPTGITSLTIQDDGNAATANTVTYTGSASGMLVVKDGLKLTLQNISMSSTKGDLLNQAGGELVVDNCELDGYTKNIYQTNGKVTIRNSDLKQTTSNNVTVAEELILEGDILVEGPPTANNVHGLYINGGAVTVNGNVTVTGAGGAGIQATSSGSLLISETATVNINGGGRAGMVVSTNGTVTVKGDLNIANTTAPAMYIGYWDGTNVGTVTVTNGGKITIGNGIKDVGIKISGAGVLDVQTGAELTISDTTGKEIDYQTGTLKLAGNVNASVVSKNLPVEVTGELTGGTVLDWTTAPSGNAITFASEAVMNASKDNITLGKTQTDADVLLHYAMDGTQAVAILVGNRVSSEAGLNAYLNVTAAKGMTDVTVYVTGSFNVANQVTIPAGITSLTILDDGNAATGNTVTYSGGNTSIFAWNDCKTLSLNGITIDGNKKGNVNVPANTRLNMTDVTVKMPYDRGVQFSGEVHLGGTVTIDNTDGNSSVWGISGAAGGVLTSDAGTVVNIKNVQYGFVANGGAKLTTDRLSVTNTANNAIYVDGSGSEMKVTTAVIDGTTEKAVYSKNGTLTIDDLSVSNHGSNSIHVNGGSVTVNKAELNVINKNVNNILVSSGSLTLKNATVDKVGQNNNICINGGTVNLHNVEVLGNDMTGGDGKHLLYANGTSKIISTGYLRLSDGSAAGIRMDGSAELTAETVEIYGTELYGIRNTGSSNFEAKKLTVGASETNDAPNIGIQSQAENTVIKITESATLSAKNYNVVGDNGTIEITGATINKTTSNNVATSAGIIKLTNSTVLGHSASGNVHAVFGRGGDIVLDNVTISGAATAGIRINNANSTVTANNVTISDCAYAVTMNAGELILNNATITAATGKSIVVDGGKQSVSGKIVADIKYNVATALNVTDALTDGSNLVVDWTTAPSGSVMTFASEAVMNVSKDYITLGSIQGASNMLKFEETAATLIPCTAVTGWSDLSTQVSTLASGSKITYRITGNASNWMVNAPLAIPAGAEVTLIADHNSPAIEVASGVSPFTLGANTLLTLENVVVGGTASAKAAHIIVPKDATLTLKNATLHNFSGSRGGAVHVNNGTLIADGSTFANNSNTTNWGGAIGIWGGTVNVSNSTFTGNTSKNSGGAIINYKADSSSHGGSTDGAVGTLTLTNCVFTNNTTSEHGGAVAAWSGGTTTITGCTFEGNSAKTNGGAVHVQDSHSMTITNCKFLSNAATSTGGAIYQKSSVQMSVTNSTFESNIATGIGGAIALYGSAEISGSTFTGNKGSEGGAISADGNLQASGTKFIGNQAETGRAGAVIVWNTRTAEFNNCEFSGNTAKTNGGAVAKGGNAGGVLKITGCDFDGNSAPNGEGGALMLQSSPTVTITGSTFTGNSAKTNGGVIKNNSSTTGMKIENSEFSNNTAGGNGGVLYQQDGNPANLINCTFTGNTAAAGNAVHSIGGTVNLTGGDIQEADCSGEYTIVKE